MKSAREKMEAARAAITSGLEAYAAQRHGAADMYFSTARNLLLQAEREDEEFEAQLRKLIEVKP